MLAGNLNLTTHEIESAYGGGGGGGGGIFPHERVSLMDMLQKIALI